MITRRRVESIAANSGFRTDTVEKVLRLCAILERLGRHPTTRGAWVLKGGTALNLLPMLRQGGEGPALDAEDLHARLSNGLEGVMERLLSWSDDERRFLDRLHDEGVVEAELLHPDPEMQARICSQPMLLWKALNVREHRGRS